MVKESGSKKRKQTYLGRLLGGSLFVGVLAYLLVPLLKPAPTKPSEKTGVKLRIQEAPTLRLHTSANFLPSKYRTWLKGEHDLPHSVKYLPARFDIASEIFAFLLVLFGYGMAILALWQFVDSLRKGLENTGDFLFAICFGLVLAIVFGIGATILLQSKFDFTNARKKQESGLVRYGIFLGDDALLYWRFTPDHEYCHLIPRERLIDAELKLKASGGVNTFNVTRKLILHLDTTEHSLRLFELDISWLEPGKDEILLKIQRWKNFTEL